MVTMPSPPNVRLQLLSQEVETVVCETILIDAWSKRLCSPTVDRMDSTIAVVCQGEGWGMEVRMHSGGNVFG